ncbi:MAG: formyltetrahydrofolate-dependent phosphoribosylglycinamide formyltransferase [Methanomicrobia archaeon]|nr:formyltetrahydrofolate-dependent phosphoribosylglycinamide formyltransferase [Methanomicrobiales archaeon]MBS1194738.1 formyltetrahydrofolate-dependent phosphoribosylglycinamide formyltransferase [Methanomicrobia archaeon]
MASGRGSNFQALIDAMKEGTLPACCLRLITDNPSAYAIERAEKAGIPVTVLDYASYPDRSAYEQALLREMRATGADLFVLAGYMRILDREIVEAFPRRILNIHPALLPSFPGLHAQRQALEHGVRVSGCSVHLVDSGTDTGPIILQRCVRVEQDDTEESLADRILEEEHRILPEAVRLFMEGRLNVQGRRVRIR